MGEALPDKEGRRQTGLVYTLKLGLCDFQLRSYLCGIILFVVRHTAAPRDFTAWISCMAQEFLKEIDISIYTLTYTDSLPSNIDIENITLPMCA